MPHYPLEFSNIRDPNIRELICTCYNQSTRVASINSHAGIDLKMASTVEGILFLMAYAYMKHHGDLPITENDFIVEATKEIKRNLNPALKEAIKNNDHKSIKKFISGRLELYHQILGVDQIYNINVGTDKDVIAILAYLICIKPLINGVIREDLNKFRENGKLFSKQFINVLQSCQDVLKCPLCLSTSASDFGTYAAEFDTYAQNFIHQQGIVKFEAITKAVVNSKLAMSFISKFLDLACAPTHVDLIESVLSIRYFMFSKRSTLSMGSLILLSLWHRTLNNDNRILNDEELSVLQEMVIKKVNNII